MKYLLVVAHPDDEVLGAGASIYKWTRQGDTVDVCIMSAEAKARAFRPEDKELDDDTHKALAYLGVNREYEGKFPNIEMNTVPHLQLVQHIEKAILESEPDIVITHHPADTNNDHLQTSMACQEAIRLAQRRSEVKPLKEFWYMEVPSCTEWAINNAMQNGNLVSFFADDPSVVTTRHAFGHTVYAGAFAGGNDAFNAIEGTTGDEEDVFCVDSHHGLFGMLASSFGWHIDHGTFQ